VCIPTPLSAGFLRHTTYRFISYSIVFGYYVVLSFCEVILLRFGARLCAFQHRYLPAFCDTQHTDLFLIPLRLVTTLCSHFVKLY
jgi:hypothetical protein